MATAQKEGYEKGILSKVALTSGLDLLLIPIVCFVVFVKAYEVFDLNLFIIAVALIYTVRNLVSDRAAWKAAQFNWLDAAVLIVVVVEVASYATSSYQANSLHYLAESLFLFFFYYLVRFNLRHDYQRAAIYAGLSLLGFWISSRALYSFWRHTNRLSDVGLHDLTQFKHLFGLVGPDYYATGERITVLLLLLPFPLILFFKLKQKKLINLLLLCPVITTLLALSVTFSRAVYIAAFSFLVVASLLFYLYKLLPAGKIVIANLVLGVVVSACLTPFAKPVLTTLSVVETESQVRSVEGRMHLWRASFDIAMLNPATGIGHYNFPMKYTSYTDNHSAFVVSTFNYFLQVLVEKGIFGLLAYAFLLLVFFVASLRSIRKRASEFHKTAIVFLVAAVAAAIARDLTYSSVFINKGANALLWFAIASNALQLERGPLVKMKALAQRSSYVWLAVALVAAAIFLWAVVRMNRAHRAELSFQAFSSRMLIADYSAAQEDIENAIALSPENAYYISSLGLLSQRMMQSRFEPDAFIANRVKLSEEDHGRVQAAIGSYERALELNPDDGCFNHNLGWLYGFSNDRQKAIDWFKKAIKLDGANALYRVSLGIFYEQLGKSEDAEREYAQAVCLSPAVLDSDFFSDFKRRSPEGAERVITDCVSYLDAIVAQTGDAFFKAKLSKVYLYNSRPEACEMLKQTTAELPNLARPWLYLGKVHESQSNPGEAKRCYEKAAFLDRTDYITALELGRAFDRQNKTADAIFHYEAAVNNWLHKPSSSARKAGRVYLTARAVPDDMVPQGLLSYVEPSFDLASICLRLAELYRSAGNAGQSDYYESLGRKHIFQAALKVER